jgi:hypothetical protein
MASGSVERSSAGRFARERVLERLTQRADDPGGSSTSTTALVSRSSRWNSIAIALLLTAPDVPPISRSSLR